MPKKVKMQRLISLARNRSLAIVTSLFFLFILIYMTQILITSTRKSVIATETVKFGGIHTENIFEGMIIRDETVYKSPSDGVVNYLVMDNTRVKKGTFICSIAKDADMVAQINENIKLIDERLIKMQEQRADRRVVSEKEKNVNSQIKNMIDNHISRFSSMDVISVYALKYMLEQNIAVRNQMILMDTDGALQGLASQKQIYLNQLAAHVSSIAADNSGVVSFRLDGWEEIVTPENMKDIFQYQFAQRAPNAAPVNQAEANRPIIKLVNSNIWYLAAYMPNEFAVNYHAGDSGIIYIRTTDGFKRLAVQIHSIASDSKESYIIYKCTKNMLDVVEKRFLSFRTQNNDQSGYIIPVTAITENFYNDQIVKGVYRVNNGLAEFKPITLSVDSIIDDGYIILNPRLNKNIQSFDRIVTDATVAKENESIYK